MTLRERIAQLKTGNAELLTGLNYLRFLDPRKGGSTRLTQMVEKTLNRYEAALTTTAEGK